MTKPKYKLSFKKEARRTGLAGVGHTPTTHIKHNKRIVGHIHPPRWGEKPRKWTVWLAVTKKDINEDGNPNCPWQWEVLPHKFDEEQQARDWLKEHPEKVDALDLHHFEPDYEQE